MDWKKLFPQFEPALIEILDKNVIERKFNAGEIIVRTGQYIKSTVLVLSGRIKIYRQNDEGGEFLIYYLGSGEACAVSLICALQSQTSEITAKAIEDTEVLLLPVQLMDELMSKYKSWSHLLFKHIANASMKCSRSLTILLSEIWMSDWSFILKDVRQIQRIRR